MTLRQRLLMPLAVMLALAQWAALGLVVRLQLAIAFVLLKPLLIRDRVGWGYLALALALVVLDVALYLRLPGELTDSRKLARRLLRLPD